MRTTGNYNPQMTQMNADFGQHPNLCKSAASADEHHTFSPLTGTPALSDDSPVKPAAPLHASASVIRRVFFCPETIAPERTSLLLPIQPGGATGAAKARLFMEF